MEPIEVFDEGKQKFLTVYVAKEVVQKCRADNSFAEALYAQIRDQNVEEGSILEIETELVEKTIENIETAIEPDYWSRKDTLHLLKLFRIHSGAPKKKSYWITLSKELGRTPEQCMEQWKTLMKTYKGSTRKLGSFPYFKEVEEVIKNVPDLPEDPETTIDDDSTGDDVTAVDSKEKWSKKDTEKLLNIIKQKGSKSKDDQFWTEVSEELANLNILKTAIKCLNRWRDIERAFRSARLKGLETKFPFYQELNELLKESLEEDNNIRYESEYKLESTEDNNSRSIIDDAVPLNNERETHHLKWTEYETLKLIDLYEKHRHKYSKFLIKNEFWNMIAEELKKEGYGDKNGTKCRSKMRNLIVSCSTSDGNKSKFAKAMEQILNGEESEREEGEDYKNETTKWTQSETTTFLSTYQTMVDYSNKDPTPDWSEISNQLSTKNINKTPKDCKQRWLDLLSIYRTHKDLNLSKTSFVHFETMDRILDYKNEAIEPNGFGCTCRQHLREDKQKRHRDRMEVVKRKLDIEERKVAAFEEYLNLLKKDRFEQI